MTKEELKRIEDNARQYIKLRDAATSEPWYFAPNSGNLLQELCYNDIDDRDVPVLCSSEIGEAQCIANWDFIINARSDHSADDVLVLAARVRELEAGAEVDRKTIENLHRMTELTRRPQKHSQSSAIAIRQRREKKEPTDAE